MIQFRHKVSGDLLTEKQLRATHADKSLPAVLAGATLDLLNVDPVLQGPKPPCGVHQEIIFNGVTYEKGVWMTCWAVRNLPQEVVAERGAQEVALHNAPILQALQDIDARSIRALREGDQVRINALEAEAAALRSQLQA